MMNSKSGYKTEAFPHLADRVNSLKEKKEGLDMMCDILKRERVEGRAEGEIVKLISQVRKKAIKKIPAEACADMLEERIDLVKLIYDTIFNHPDWDDIRICEELQVSLTQQ